MQTSIADDIPDYPHTVNFENDHIHCPKCRFEIMFFRLVNREKGTNNIITKETELKCDLQIAKDAQDEQNQMIHDMFKVNKRLHKRLQLLEKLVSDYAYFSANEMIMKEIQRIRMGELDE